jgi:hypothetical protein
MALLTFEVDERSWVCAKPRPAAHACAVIAVTSRTSVCADTVVKARQTSDRINGSLDAGSEPQRDGGSEKSADPLSSA